MGHVNMQLIVQPAYLVRRIGVAAELIEIPSGIYPIVFLPETWLYSGNWLYKSCKSLFFIHNSIPTRFDLLIESQVTEGSIIYNPWRISDGNPLNNNLYLEHLRLLSNSYILLQRNNIRYFIYFDLPKGKFFLGSYIQKWLLEILKIKTLANMIFCERIYD